MRARIAAFAFGLLMLATAAHGQSPRGKPRVPPGVDPGGVAIAIIGAGIDYTRPEIARRLARDGEGEPIGWDFIDNDRRPYNSCNGTAAETLCLNDFIEDAMERQPKTRLIVLRARSGAPQALVEVVQAAIKTPARVILMASLPPPPSAFVHEAAARYPGFVFVAISATPVTPTLPAGNAITVTLPATEDPAVAMSAAAAFSFAFGAADVLNGNPATDAAAVIRLLRQQPIQGLVNGASVAPSPSTGKQEPVPPAPGPPR